MAWHWQSASYHAAVIASGKVSSFALVEHYISRVEAFDDRINAVVVRTFDTARARARLADEALANGISWGPLHGVPITVKESLWVENALSTNAIPEYIDFVATSNAPAVQRLLDAGAIIIGKTNLPVSSADIQSYNEKYGTTNNPWDLSRVPGGSSGGSAAAMAAGLSALDLATDIAGSIRNPAHFCGVCGHKPTQGIVPWQGVSPASNHPEIEPDPKPQQDRFDPSFGHMLRVIGPIARTCADLELALRIIAGPEPFMQKNGWAFTLPPAKVVEPAGLRVAAWLDDPVCPVDSECVALMTRAAKALETAGATVDFQARPDLKFEKSEQQFLELLAIETFQPGALAQTSVAEFQRIQKGRWNLKQKWMQFFKRFDVLLCPVIPMTAFKHDHTPDKGLRKVNINGVQRNYLKSAIAWAGLVIFPDLPSTVVPIGRDSAGLPCGMQVVASHWQDLQTIEVGKMLERLGFCFEPPDGYDQQKPLAAKL